MSVIPTTIGCRSSASLLATGRRAEGRGGRGRVATAWLLGALLAGALLAQRGEEVAQTKHNLSVSGPGPVHALTETRICVFCHTPHNATPQTPLWNRAVEPQTYQTYTSPTLKAGPLPQPTGATKLCLSCHDGTIATGAVVMPSTGIQMSNGGALPNLSNFGLDLSGHHPVSFPYQASLPNSELASPPPSALTFGGGGELHCTTCHDPHNDANGRFLVKDNRYSGLCTTCHKITGWETSAHATSTASVTGILPRPENDWPQWNTLGEWGCESCHTPHRAPTGPEILLFNDGTTGATAFSCTTSGCHGGDPGQPHAIAAHLVAGKALAKAVPGTGPAGGTDIAGQLRKVSAHRSLPGSFAATTSTGGPGRNAGRDVTCADCHNPHTLTNRPATGPYVSGLLAGVSGIDRNGAAVPKATYEYEICFKCHSESSGQMEAVPRVVSETNTRLEFDPTNPSFHPVVAAGHNAEVPSLGTSLQPTLHIGDQINCTSCHADDGGTSNGPHGSAYPPILRLRYETTDGTPESYDAYALCYQCHDRTRILSDESFRKATVRTTPSGGGHSGHLAAGISCAACHDPHGIPATAARDTGSHQQLINFDLRVVQPLPGATYPVYSRTGTYAGTCSLVCHGVVHNATSYR